LKTVVVALDEKVKVIDSLKDDLAKEKEHSKQSEEARYQL